MLSRDFCILSVCCLLGNSVEHLGEGGTPTSKISSMVWGPSGLFVHMCSGSVKGLVVFPQRSNKWKGGSISLHSLGHRRQTVYYVLLGVHWGPQKTTQAFLCTWGDPAWRMAHAPRLNLHHWRAPLSRGSLARAGGREASLQVVLVELTSSGGG